MRQDVHALSHNAQSLLWCMRHMHVSVYAVHHAYAVLSHRTRILSRTTHNRRASHILNACSRLLTTGVHAALYFRYSRAVMKQPQQQHWLVEFILKPVRLCVRNACACACKCVYMWQMCVYVCTCVHVYAWWAGEAEGGREALPQSLSGSVYRCGWRKARAQAGP
jgi:hypothetical protein